MTVLLDRRLLKWLILLSEGIKASSGLMRAPLSVWYRGLTLPLFCNHLPGSQWPSGLADGFLPEGLLARVYPDAGGVWRGVKKAFGDRDKIPVRLGGT